MGSTPQKDIAKIDMGTQVRTVPSAKPKREKVKQITKKKPRPNLNPDNNNDEMFVVKKRKIKKHAKKPGDQIETQEEKPPVQRKESVPIEEIDDQHDDEQQIQEVKEEIDQKSVEELLQETPGEPFYEHAQTERKEEFKDIQIPSLKNIKLEPLRLCKSKTTFNKLCLDLEVESPQDLNFNFLDELSTTKRNKIRKRNTQNNIQDLIEELNNHNPMQ